MEINTKLEYDRKRERMGKNECVVDYDLYRDTSVFYIVASLFYLVAKPAPILEFIKILFNAKHDYAHSPWRRTKYCSIAQFSKNMQHALTRVNTIVVQSHLHTASIAFIASSASTEKDAQSEKDIRIRHPSQEFHRECIRLLRTGSKDQRSYLGVIQQKIVLYCAYIAHRDGALILFDKKKTQTQSDIELDVNRRRCEAVVDLARKLDTANTISFSSAPALLASSPIIKNGEQMRGITYHKKLQFKDNMFQAFIFYRIEASPAFENIVEYKKEDTLAEKIGVLEKYHVTYNISEFDQMMKSIFSKQVVSSAFLANDNDGNEPVFQQDVLATFVARLTRNIVNSDLALLSTVNAKMTQTVKDFIDLDMSQVSFMQSWNTANIDNIFLFFRESISVIIRKKNIVRALKISQIDDAHKSSTSKTVTVIVKMSKRVKKVITNQSEHIGEMLASLAKIARIKSKLDKRLDVVLSLFTYCWLSVVVELTVAASQTQIPNAKLHKEMTTFLRSFFRAEARRKMKLDRR